MCRKVLDRFLGLLKFIHIFVTICGRIKTLKMLLLCLVDFIYFVINRNCDINGANVKAVTNGSPTGTLFRQGLQIKQWLEGIATLVDENIKVFLKNWIWNQEEKHWPVFEILRIWKHWFCNIKCVWTSRIKKDNWMS